MVFQLANPQSESFDPSVAQVAAVAGMTAMNPKVSDGADVGALYDALFAADPEGAARVLAGTDGSYDLALFTIQTQAGEAAAPELADDLTEDFAPVAATGAAVTATSDEIISHVVVTTLQASQVASLIYTLVAVLLLLVANFWFEVRRPLLGVITTLPVMLVVVAAFGLMWALGIPFGPITATVAALAVGIGIPYMIHVTHRYEEDRIATDDENAAVELTLTHTGGALAGSALTTIFGFGILMTSTTIPFRQFGFVTAYTILLSLLAASSSCRRCWSSGTGGTGGGVTGRSSPNGSNTPSGTLERRRPRRSADTGKGRPRRAGPLPWSWRCPPDQRSEIGTYVLSMSPT